MGRGFLVVMFVLDALLFAGAFLVEQRAVALCMAFGAGFGAAINWDSWKRFTALQNRARHT